MSLLTFVASSKFRSISDLVLALVKLSDIPRIIFAHTCIIFLIFKA